MSGVEEAIRRVFGSEGEFSTDRSDPGNWTGGKVNSGRFKGTKYGISAASFPDLDIKNLTMAQAADIYRRLYWNRVRGDELPFPLAFILFDAAVNSGVGASIKWLQEVVGVEPDGGFGPVTMAAVKSYTPESIIARVVGRRMMQNTSLDIWPQNGRGWTHRNAKNLMDVPLVPLVSLPVDPPEPISGPLVSRVEALEAWRASMTGDGR